MIVSLLTFIILMASTDIADLKKIFDQFDLDKNGTISLTELGSVAQKLGSPMDAQQLKEICQKLDTNKDGKISFKEFQYWWVKGKQGNLMKLVFLKAKAMKMTNFIHEKFTAADINLLNHKGNVQPDKFDISFKFGEPSQDCIHFGFSFYSKGQGEKQAREKCKLLCEADTAAKINENTFGFFVVLPSKNPQAAKDAFEEMLKNIFCVEGSPVQDIENNPFFKYQSRVGEKEFVLSFITMEEMTEMAAPMTENAHQVFSAIGEDFYSCLNVDLKINSSCDDLLDKNMLDNLMKGFSFSTNMTANKSVLGKIRKLAEMTQKDTPAMVNLLTLIRSKKFHLNLRSPKQMEIFMKKMGITEAVEALPTLSDLLQGMSQELCKQKQQNIALKMVHLVSRFALKHVENNVNIHLLLGPIGTMSVDLSAKNITRAHSVLFNEA